MNNGQSPNPQDQKQKPALAMARTAIVIEVMVNGQQQIYDVATATELQRELGLALMSLQPPVPTKVKAARKTARKKR